MKKLSLIFCFLGYLVSAFSATRTISNAGGNFNSTSTWVEGVVPTAADDVVATATSGKLIVNVNSVAKTITLTNYVDTLVMNANLSVSGAVTLGTAMQYTGSSNLICLTAATLTSSGVAISGGLQLNGTSQTFTLADNWAVNGVVTCGGTTATTINGNTLTCNGGYTQTNVATVSGTTAFVLAGGTWSSTLNSNVLRNNVTFAGDVTLGTNVAYNTGTITYISGSINSSASTLTCVLGTTFNCKGMAWNNVTLGGTSQTYTLADTLDVNGLLTCNGTTATTINGYVIKVGGGYAQNIVASVAGTSEFLFDGKGSWTGGATLFLSNNLVINLTDTLTIPASVAYRTGTFTYKNGIVNTGGSTLVLGSAISFSSGIDSILWNNITLTGTSQTYTLTHDLVVPGALALSGATALSFSGAYNISCSNLSLNTPTITGTGDITVSGITSIVGATTLNGGFKLRTSGISAASSLSGNYKIIITGGGVWTGSGAIYCNMDLDGSTTITGTVSFGGKLTGDTLAYLSGTITTTGSTLSLYAGVVNGKIVLNLPGISWNNLYLGNGDFFVTLLANMDVNGNLSMYSQATPSIIYVDGFTMTIGGNLTCSGGSNARFMGTTNFVMDGKGTWSGGPYMHLYHNLTFNTTDTITISGTVSFAVKTLTYVAGTIVTTGSTLLVSAVNAPAYPTFNTNGMTWNNVSFGVGAILASDMNIAGSLTLPGQGYAYNGAYTYRVSQNINIANTGNSGGTSTFLLNGKGALSTHATGAFSGNVVVNTSDTVTLGTYVNLNGGTLTCTAGSIVATGSTLGCITNTSTLNINGSGFSLETLTSTGSMNFTGSNGFAVKNFTCTTPGKTFTFASGNNYSITNNLTIAGTSASRISFLSGTSGTAANVTLSQAALQDMAFCNFTDITNNGLRFWTYKGIITRSEGVSQLKTEPQTVSYTF